MQNGGAYTRILEKYYTGQPRLGLGSGRTMVPLMERLAQMIRGRGAAHSTVIVPTSTQSQMQVLLSGLMPTDVSAVSGVDIYFDGADYVDVNRRAVLKGHGGALTLEKLVAYSSEETVIIVQPHKLVGALDKCMVPVEILPGARRVFASLLESENLRWALREGSGKIGPLVTELGNFIVDVEYREEFFCRCKAIPGVVDHGYFPPSPRMKIEVLEKD